MLKLMGKKVFTILRITYAYSFISIYNSDEEVSELNSHLLHWKLINIYFVKYPCSLARAFAAQIHNIMDVDRDSDSLDTSAWTSKGRFCTYAINLSTKMCCPILSSLGYLIKNTISSGAGLFI